MIQKKLIFIFLLAFILNKISLGLLIDPIPIKYLYENHETNYSMIQDTKNKQVLFLNQKNVSKFFYQKKLKIKVYIFLQGKEEIEFEDIFLDSTLNDIINFLKNYYQKQLGHFFIILNKNLTIQIKGKFTIIYGDNDLLNENIYSKNYLSLDIVNLENIIKIFQAKNSEYIDIFKNNISTYINFCLKTYLEKNKINPNLESEYWHEILGIKLNLLQDIKGGCSHTEAVEMRKLAKDLILLGREEFDFDKKEEILLKAQINFNRYYYLPIRNIKTQEELLKILTESLDNIKNFLRVLENFNPVELI